MKKTILFSLLILFAICVASIEAQGTTEEDIPKQTILESQDVLNSLTNLIKDSSKKWVLILKDYALSLFVILAGLNLVIRAIMMLLEGNVDSAKVGGFLARYFFVAIIFYFILDNGVEFASDIINSFIQLGDKASNFTGNSTSVDRLLSIAYTMMNTTLDSISLTNVAQPIISFILSFATYIVLLLIVANYIVEVCATWILVYAGYFVLAFGGSEWTREIAISYLKAVISSGLRLLSIMFMIGIAIEMLDKYSTNLGVSFAATLLAFAVAIILLILMNKIPDAIGSLASSSWGHMSGFNMASAMAVSMMAVKMASGGVKSAFEGAKSFKAGAADYMINKATGGENNSARSGSGLSYEAGKGSAFIADKLLGKKNTSNNSSSFGKSDLMSSSNNSNSTNSNSAGNKNTSTSGSGGTSSQGNTNIKDNTDKSTDNANKQSNQKEK